MATKTLAISKNIRITQEFVSRHAPWLRDAIIPRVDDALFKFSAARSAIFGAEFTALRLMAERIPGTSKLPKPEFTSKQVKALTVHAEELLKRDARNIRRGLYPLAVLKPELPIRHLLRLPRLAWDGASMQLRRLRGHTTAFSPEARQYLDELPRYYRRNYHFQTDGYLTEHSAEIYEHQVEMLFGGTADAMRRMILPPLKAALPATDGHGMRILELGCGVGTTTRFLRATFPRARITAIDLSDPYIQRARKRLGSRERLDLVQGDAGQLPYQDGHFDAVVSVFLLHELPIAERQKVLAEAKRVLKPEGFMGMIDSIQLGEMSPLDELIEDFPARYHEPYYREYLAHPIEKDFADLAMKGVQTEFGFFSKVVYGTK